jgi:hypothetical protein
VRERWVSGIEIVTNGPAAYPTTTQSTNPRSGTMTLNLTIADEVATRGDAIIPDVLDAGKVMKHKLREEVAAK